MLLPLILGMMVVVAYMAMSNMEVA